MALWTMSQEVKLEYNCGHWETHLVPFSWELDTHPSWMGFCGPTCSPRDDSLRVEVREEQAVDQSGLPKARLPWRTQKRSSIRWGIEGPNRSDFISYHTLIWTGPIRPYYTALDHYGPLWRLRKNEETFFHNVLVFVLNIYINSGFARLINTN